MCGGKNNEIMYLNQHFPEGTVPEIVGSITGIAFGNILDRYCRMFEYVLEYLEVGEGEPYLAISKSDKAEYFS